MTLEYQGIPLVPAGKVLLLSTASGGQTGRSGYSVLAEYISGGHLILTMRTDPQGRLARLATGMISRLTLSRWYRSGSAQMELKACRYLMGGFNGVVHVLWADCDMGFIDVLRSRKRHPLCGTFHTPPSKLVDIINYPSRLRALDRIILMSAVQKRFFEAQGVGKDRLRVVHHGVDTSYFRPGDGGGIERFTVLFVGMFLRNFVLLREVCEALLPMSDVVIKIVSAPAMRPMFAGLRNVVFAPRLSDAELLDAYQSASCLLMTIEDATANNAVLEAMACGLPVVSERVGGIPEYVNGECAYLTEPGRAEPILRALKRLRESASLRIDMGEASRRRAKELKWENAAAQTMEIYRELRV
jgi:glycosyltransferase involved in cell wall biosynthesis